MGHAFYVSSYPHGAEEGFRERDDIVSGFVEAGNIIMIWMIIKYGNDPVCLENCCVVPCSSHHCCMNIIIKSFDLLR